ncbi:hypothetical protein ACQ4PT_026878 [Festuca glaucescens]
MESMAAVEMPVTVPAFDVSSRRPATAGLVLNSPNPPSLRDELVGVVGKVFRPRRANGDGGGARRCAWVLTALQAVFPVLQWGKTYNLKSFRSDVMAGLTLASLGIPQSIGYANLAKLDPQYGLYTSVVPPLIYAVMGTSREIAIGPVAVVSLLLSSMVQKIVDPASDPVTYRTLVFTVTFLAGVFQVSFGLFRLGFLVDFLSHAAIVGFMGGAAIVIGLQQLKGLLGLSKFTNSTDVVSVAKAVFSALHDPVRQLLTHKATGLTNGYCTEQNKVNNIHQRIVSLSRLLFRLDGKICAEPDFPDFACFLCNKIGIILLVGRDKAGLNFPSLPVTHKSTRAIITQATPPPLSVGWMFLCRNLEPLLELSPERKKKSLSTRYIGEEFSA